MKDYECKQIETVSSNSNDKKKMLERKLYEFLENYAEEDRERKLWPMIIYKNCLFPKINSVQSS